MFPTIRDDSGAIYQNRLAFNADKYEFWQIYDRIKHFYPIGIPKETNLYYTYPGWKELEALLIENIHESANLKARWEDFTDKIQQQLGKPIVGTTFGQAPSFSSYIQLDQLQFANVTHTKELHFFVSLIGPFYTIVGQEAFSMTVGDREFRSTNHLVISPENEFKPAFLRLEEAIEEQFKDYRFVPFTICRQTMEGLDARYNSVHLNAIFHALFNDQIDINQQAWGDEHYKAADWMKEGHVDVGGGWTIYPPGVQLTIIDENN